MPTGYDLLGLVTGSEGMLGVVTEVTVRILRTPESARAAADRLSTSSEAAATASPRIIAAGIIPGGMEMMDKPAIKAAEDFVHAGYPLDAEALLDRRARRPACRGRSSARAGREIRAAHGALTCRISNSEAERLAFWAGRKAAFPAVGRISPDYYCMDGTIPRKQLPQRARTHAGNVRQVRAARRQRLPRRRRQSASADPLRRQQAGRARARRGIWRRYFAAVRGGRRRADRRARRRRREARSDAGDVQRRSISPSSSGSNAPSTKADCSIRAKCFPMLHRCAELGRMHVHRRSDLRFPICPRF